MKSKDASSPIFFVYVYFYLDGIPCYVGKGKGNRWKSHFHRTGNKTLRGIIKQAGGDLPVVIVQERLVEKDAFDTEVALIKAIGRRDLGEGPLVNHTNGGDGAVGVKRSAEYVDNMRRRMLGKKLSPQTIAKLVASRLGRPLNHGAKIAAARRGIPRRLEHVATSVANKKIKREERLAQGLPPKTWWHAPDGTRYMDVRARSVGDVPGHGMPIPPAMLGCTKGTHWWTTPDGVHYRSVVKRSDDDFWGRR